MKNNYLMMAFFILCFNCLFCNQIFYSQASQDEFVYTILYDLLKKKDCGYYLDIGANHPISTNNSYFFEKNMEWNGISIDISAEHQQNWQNTRKNTLLIANAMLCDYRSLLSTVPYSIDYLSIDVDCDYDIILKRIPFDEHIFKVITIEHDSYLYGDKYKDRERAFLESVGYYLLCPDVSLDWNHNSCVQQCAFEDWWVHSSIFSEELFQRLKILDLTKKDHSQIIRTLQNL